MKNILIFVSIIVLVIFISYTLSNKKNTIEKYLDFKNDEISLYKIEGTPSVSELNSNYYLITTSSKDTYCISKDETPPEIVTEFKDKLVYEQPEKITVKGMFLAGRYCANHIQFFPLTSEIIKSVKDKELNN